MAALDTPRPDDEQVVRLVFERVRSRDLSVVDLFAPDAVLVMPGAEHRGRGAIEAFYRGVFGGVGPRPQVGGLWASGSTVVALLEVVADGRTLHTIDVFTLDAGLITEMRYLAGGLEPGWTPRGATAASG